MEILDELISVDKTQQHSFLLLDVDNLRVFAHRDFLLRLATSGPLYGVHNKRVASRLTYVVGAIPSECMAQLTPGCLYECLSLSFFCCPLVKFLGLSNAGCGSESHWLTGNDRILNDHSIFLSPTPILHYSKSFRLYFLLCFLVSGGFSVRSH